MNILNSKIFTVVLLVACAWMLFSVISSEIEKGEVGKDSLSVENKISNIRSRNDNMEKYIKNFDNPDFLEKEARSRLNYKATGEEVVFVHKDPTNVKPSSSEDFDAKHGINYKKLFDRLFKR